MAKSVTTIPATLSRFTAAPINSTKKRRVAAYARVSTDNEEQLTSYEAQIDYYTNYINGRDDWEFVGVYPDEGITGTNTKKREQFRQMVADALDDKIDLIITKSVSRFARNTVDSLTTIRKLKEHNVEVYFEKENIWTFDSKGELLLTIMSSLAQEESRSISENCTWGQRKRFADGKVTVPFKRFLGYDMGPDHNLVVNPEQAKLVKRIYGMFLQGQSPFQIARTLTEEGIPSPGDKDHWNPSNIKSILTNEKYKGDALLQKSFTVDFLTKKKKTNEGEIPQYYVKDNHEAIIDPETFEMVQTLMTTRTKGRNRKSSVSIFSSKVKCGDCGSWYGPKVWHSNDAYRKVIWQCNHKFDGRKCTTPTLNEEQIKALFLKAANTIIGAKEQFIAIFERTLAPALATDELERELADLEAEINIAAELVEECIRENAHVALDQAEYQKRYDGLASRYDKAKDRHDEVTELIAERISRRKRIELYFRELRKREPLETFRDEDWLSMVDHMTVYSKDGIRVTFKDGTEIET
nr:MAG TPA: integrase [Caudoviricetes sp.]